MCLKAVRSSGGARERSPNPQGAGPPRRRIPGSHERCRDQCREGPARLRGFVGRFQDPSTRTPAPSGSRPASSTRGGESPPRSWTRGHGRVAEESATAARMPCRRALRSRLSFAAARSHSPTPHTHPRCLATARSAPNADGNPTWHRGRRPYRAQTVSSTLLRHWNRLSR